MACRDPGLVLANIGYSNFDRAVSIVAWNEFPYLMRLLESFQLLLAFS